MTDLENSTIEDNPFIKLSKKVLITLENLIKQDDIAIPIQFDTMLELSVAALVDAQASGEVDLVEIFYFNKEFSFDSLVFQEGGEHTLHDILAQIVCFRLIDMIKEFLNHINISYTTEESLSEIISE
jgi:hypothetical protein